MYIVRLLQLIIGKKPKRLNISDVPPRKENSHYVSSDSDLESYDVSSGCDKEPVSGRPCKKEGISYKMTPSSSQQHKGIV